MKVLYLGGFCLPDKNAAAQRVVSNSKALVQLGYEVKLIGFDKEPASFVYEGLDCMNLLYPSSLKGWLMYLTTLHDYSSHIKEFEPSVIIAYNHPAIALGKLEKFCKRHSIKLISDCTEWYTPGGNIIRKFLKRWDTRQRMTKVHLRMDGIISISRYLHEYYQSKGVKSLLLPPLVDIESEKWKQPTKIEDNDSLTLVYAGSPGYKDRLDIIINIMKDLLYSIPLRFDVIGLTKEQFVKLYSYSEKIPNNVCFKGRLPHQSVLKELALADFQLFVRDDNLTTRAGFPTKFVESISAGVPVMTNLTSNIGDYLKDGVNGYILDASNADTLKKSLSSVLSLPRGVHKSIKSSIDRATFDYRRYVPQIKSFIDSL